MPAERAIGCSFAELFKSAADVEANGGVVTGTPTFVDGFYVSDGSSHITYGQQYPTGVYTKLSISFDIKGYLGAPADFEGLVTSRNGAVNGYDIGINNTRFFFSFRGAGGASLNLTLATASVDILDGKRHSIVCTNDGANSHVYFDGVLEATAAGTVGVNTTEALEIGARDGLAPMEAGHKIGSVKIYTSALVKQDAINKYNGTTYNYPNEALVHLPMQAIHHDPTNGRTLDVSGNDNHALITGATKLQKRGYYLDGSDYFTMTDNLAGESELTINMVHDVEVFGNKYLFTFLESGGGIGFALRVATNGQYQIIHNAGGGASSLGLFASRGLNIFSLTLTGGDVAQMTLNDGQKSAEFALTINNRNGAFLISRTSSAFVGNVYEMSVNGTALLTPLQMADLRINEIKRINRV